MPAMRVSLVARFVSHPTIDFGVRRHAANRPRLGLERMRTVYHRPRSAVAPAATVRALRSQTSRFRFPAVGHAARVPSRSPALPHGVPRSRRS
jgi:hypothetical protein